MTVSGPSEIMVKPVTDMIIKSFIESLLMMTIGTYIFFGFKLLISALYKIWPEEDPFLREGVGLAIIAFTDALISFLSAKKDNAATNEVKGLAWAIIGLGIAITSIYLPTGLEALILAVLSLGAALRGYALTKKPNPTDIGPLGKVEELIAKVSVAYCFVALVDTGISCGRKWLS